MLFNSSIFEAHQNRFARFCNQSLTVLRQYYNCGLSVVVFVVSAYMVSSNIRFGCLSILFLLQYFLLNKDYNLN